MSVWLKAAELVATGRPHKHLPDRWQQLGCCDALEAIGAGGGRLSQLRDTYFPDDKYGDGYWWGSPNNDPEREQNRTARVIALCLMHELEKDGQL